MAVINAFFDESFDARWFCVAGYVFKKSKLKLFDQQWRLMLATYDLPYFRMSACAHDPGNFPFNKLTKPQRIAVVIRAIELIKKYAAIGFAVALDPTSFEKNLVKNKLISTAYEYCVWMCLAAVRTWVEDSNHVGNVSYFFEDGQEHRSKANLLINRIISEAALKKRYKYAGHEFVKKELSQPAQAADLLSWLFFKECKRLADTPGKPQRKDYMSLIQLPHHVLFKQPNELFESKASILKNFSA